MTADKIVLNTPSYKGEYELDIIADALTMVEWQWVKKISGYTLGTANDGYADRDPSFFVALAVVALVRAGRLKREDVFLAAAEMGELPFDANMLRYVDGTPEEEEQEADPTMAALEPPEPQQNTGASSSSTSEPRQAPALSPTGAPD